MRGKSKIILDKLLFKFPEYIFAKHREQIKWLKYEEEVNHY